MSRTAIVTVGMLSVLMGIQLNLVDSFVLTPRATRFWQSKLGNFGSGAAQLRDNVAGYANGFSNGIANGAGNYLPSAGYSPQNPLYSPGGANSQYSQYSRSYARSNYPFNTPNYASRPTGLPSYQGSGTNNGFGAFNGTPATQAGFATNSAAKPFASFTNGLLGPQKVITPPKWISWAGIFLGAVLFIFGAARGRG